MKRALALLLGFGALALAFLKAPEQSASSGAAPPGLGAARFLGPVRHLAAGVQWTRFEAARSEGRYELAYARAESSLRLAPERPEGWQMLAWHFAYERGEAGTGRSLEERRAWLEAGLETLDLGAQAALAGEAPRSAAELRFSAGLLLAAEASLETRDVSWPGGASTAWSRAAEYFDQAAAAGHLLAPEAAQRARANAAESIRER